jgi:transposase-like protein
VGVNTDGRREVLGMEIGTSEAEPIWTEWPAAGFVDTEIRCLTELESWNAEKEVQPRVQA